MQLFYVKRKAPNFLRAFLLMQQSNPNEYLLLYNVGIMPVLIANFWWPIFELGWIFGV